ncbi:hypothetical protein ACT8ZV_04665 [Nocardioides sp. MAHUQ-72]|uniref:hypothetical protein n=1 Tax=unclassified Nocardioides TaxID=2615069 RepID=UPI0036241E63
MPWWLVPGVLGLGSVLGGVCVIRRGRRFASGGDRAQAVRGATLTVLGTMLVTSGCTAAAVVAMLSYALR